MNFKQLILLAGIVPAISLASCDDNEPDNSVTTDFASVNLEYGEDGVWADCLNQDITGITCQGITFAHQATESPYGSYWSGFCPSRSSDVADYTDNGDWLAHQCNVMTGGGIAGKGTPFMVAYWNTMDTPEEPSLKISLADGASFSAESVYINNTTYAYYAMTRGTSFSKKFGQGDWCKVIFHGMQEYINGQGELKYQETGTVEYYLADMRNGSEETWTVTNQWSMVNLEPLNAGGSLNYIYITMESSDSGQWGMNNPAYFALDRLKIRLAE